MAINSNHVLGLLCIITGIVVAVFAIGDLLFRVLIAVASLALINYGLRLRGLPPLQMLIPLLASRKRWF